MDTTNKNELLQLMITHPEATAAICDTQWDYTKYVWEKTICPALQGLASAMKLEYEDTGDLWNGRKYSGFSFKKGHWGCYFEAGKTGMYDLYYGFDFEGIAKKLKPKIPLFGGFQKKSSAWPYGWAWLDERYVNWDMKTLADIVANTDDFVKYIKGKIQVVLDELERQGIQLE